MSTHATTKTPDNDVVDLEYLEKITRPDNDDVSAAPAASGADSQVEESVVKIHLSDSSKIGSNLPVAHANAFDPVLERPFQSNTSLLADGMIFIGDVTLNGPFNVSGSMTGNIAQSVGAQVSVVVELDGVVKGDISAVDVAVKGTTDGVIDANQGEVLLHDSACVKGLIRYGRIKVNGADLNATLERVDQFKNKPRQ